MSKALRAFMVRLAHDLDALTAFMSNPKEALAAADLSDEERAALLSGDQQRIYRALHPEYAQAVPPPPAAPVAGAPLHSNTPWTVPVPPPPPGYPPQGAAPFPGYPPPGYPPQGTAPFPGYPPAGPAPNYPAAPQHDDQTEEGGRVR